MTDKTLTEQSISERYIESVKMKTNLNKRSFENTTISHMSKVDFATFLELDSKKNVQDPKMRLVFQ